MNLQIDVRSVMNLFCNFEKLGRTVSDLRCIYRLHIFDEGSKAGEGGCAIWRGRRAKCAKHA